MTKKDLSTLFDRKSKTLYPSEFDSQGIRGSRSRLDSRIE